MVLLMTSSGGERESAGGLGLLRLLPLLLASAADSDGSSFPLTLSNINFTRGSSLPLLGTASSPGFFRMDLSCLMKETSSRERRGHAKFQILDLFCCLGVARLR